MNLNAIRGLLIDIDDTIVRFKAAGAGTEQRPPNSGSLLDVLQRAGEELAGLTAEETTRRIAQIKKDILWWHWSDFIVKLDLNPKRFWEYAYEVESQYLEPTGPEILPALNQLKEQGMLLYVTSNNPSSGILHKLRMAGIGQMTGTTLFSQLLGASELHAMKCDPLYWKKVLAHIALDAHEVAVVGDALRDDYEVPHTVGIAGTFLINRHAEFSAQNTATLIHVTNFMQIADRILATNRKDAVR